MYGISNGLEDGFDDLMSSAFGALEDIDFGSGWDDDSFADTNVELEKAKEEFERENGEGTWEEFLDKSFIDALAAEGVDATDAEKGLEELIAKELGALGDLDFSDFGSGFGDITNWGLDCSFTDSADCISSEVQQQIRLDYAIYLYEAEGFRSWYDLCILPNVEIDEE